jgi:AraC-like DNA-binding protein
MRAITDDVIPQQQTEHAEGAAREAQRAQANREELVERIAQAIREDGEVQPLQGLYFARSSVSLELLHSVVRPSLCVIAQGSKEVLLGQSRFLYDPAHYLLATVELPWISQVVDASQERPYLSLRLELPPAVVGAIMLEAVEAGLASGQGGAPVRAMDISPLDGSLLDAVVRLARLVDTPSAAPILLPLTTQEIVYRLLLGAQGARLRHLSLQAGYTAPIARAVARLRHDFDQPLRIEELAHDLGMSVSGFHQHFKVVTAMSPLQYQKRIRLQEARRLMLSEGLDAISAAYRVGYRDASHFNREYKAFFGAPPLRDVRRLRGGAMQSAG